MASGEIEEAKVGLNFEDPMDSSMISSITFGYFDEGSVKKGERGMNWFPNVGTDTWAMGITEPPTYNGEELYEKGEGPKIAHIDTASLNIVVPEAEFTKLLQAMRKVDPTITTYSEDKWLGNILKSS